MNTVLQTAYGAQVEVFVSVHRRVHLQFAVGGRQVYDDISPDDAREIAQRLLTAADEVER